MSTRTLSLWGVIVVVLIAAVGSIATSASPAAAHNDNSTVPIYNPIVVPGNPNATSAWWAWSQRTSPPGHRRVYSNWGYTNDWSIDIFARRAGRPIVTPFGTKTNTGHNVRSTVIDVRPGCASGRVADGGYRVTIEARDTKTGSVLGRADVMHVDRPRVKKGDALGPWTTIGYTARFRYNGCYEVTRDWGIHVHLEVINRHRYACWQRYNYEAPLTGYSRLGVVGSHSYTAPRARC